MKVSLRDGYTQRKELLAQALERCGLDLPATLAGARAKVPGAVAEHAARLEAQGYLVQCQGIGCNGCCRGEIPLSTEEWVDLRPHIPADVLARITAPPRREEQRRRRRCPLLGPDGGCTVYAWRPMACRGHHVVTPPRLCHPELVGTQTVHWFVDAVSKAYIALHGSLLLQDALWQEAERFQRRQRRERRHGA